MPATELSRFCTSTHLPAPIRTSSLILLAVLFALPVNGLLAQERPTIRPNEHDLPETKPLSPEESFKTFHVADDLKLDQVLTDPLVAQPLQISFDTRGRLWLVEYRQYPMPAGLKVTSHDVYWRAIYDKVPPPPPNHDRGQDRISIHEDADGDGTFETHKVFVDGLNIATACAVGPDGVWVLNPPYLLFYPDRNQDDIPDGDPEVHLEGFGLQDTHSVANSLTWGPDGWLYAAQGSTVTGEIRRTGIDEKPLKSLGQNIWRYHPQTRQYELFAEGGGNAFCVEIDAEGRIFSGHNGGNTRGFHYVQGGYYRKGFSKHGPLSNPHAYGFFDAMTHEQVRRFTHSIMRYDARTLPEKYWDTLFGVEPLQGTVVNSRIDDQGSTFATHDLGHPLTSDDPWFRPVDVKLGPDGAVYVADWYDGRVAHLLTMEEQVDNTRGRVYRLAPKEGKLDPLTNLQKVSVDQVLEELNHPNRTRRYLARQRLRELEDLSFLAKLDQALKAETAAYPLELFWARHSIKPYTDQELAGFWQHKSAPVREWSVRLACDDGTLQDSESSELSALATGETDVAVRSQILCSARRLPPRQTLSLTLTMLDRESDAQDPHLPLLYWWNVESVISRDPAVLQELIDSDPDQLLNRRLFADLLAENLIRRLVSSREIPLQKLCQSILILGVDQPFAARFVKGFELGLAGRSLVEVPVQLLTAVRELGSLPLPLRLRMNEAAAIDEVLELLAGSQAADKKLPLLQVASEVNEPRLAQAVLHLAQTATAPEVRTAAWLALQGPLGDQLPLSVKSIPSEITSWDSREVSAMCHTFSSRVAWARQLVAAVDQGIVNKDLVPADVIRRLSFHQDERLRADVARIWKSVAGLATAEMAATMTRLAGVLDQLEGDPYRGKPLFKQQCGKCHELFEEGEYVGPSLTSYQRTDRTHLLRHIVNPSLEIREGFEVKVVLTDDGRILTGFTTFEDEESLVIRGSEGSDVRVLKEQIEEIIPQPVSLMPAGMLEKLSDQEVADLFSYLQSAQPLNN